MSASSSSRRFKRIDTTDSRFEVVWEHGIWVEGAGVNAECVYCGKIVSGSIFRFNYHLAGSKENIEACHSVPNDVRALMLQFLTDLENESNGERRQFADYGEDTLLNDVKGKGKGIMKLTKKPKISGNGVTITAQSTDNEIFRKDREEVCQQVARFFYSSGIPLIALKIQSLQKCVR